MTPRRTLAIPTSTPSSVQVTFRQTLVDRVRWTLRLAAGDADARFRLDETDVHLAQLRESFRFPFDQVCDALGLEGLEREMLVLCAAVHLAPEVRELIRPLRNETRVDGVLALRLYGDRALASVQRFRDSVLVEVGLVEQQAPRLLHTPSPLEWEIVATPRLLGILEGQLIVEPQLAGIASAFEVTADDLTGIVADAEQAHLEEIARMLGPRAPAMVLLSGPDGIGKAQAAGALAAMLGRRFIVHVRATLLPGAPGELIPVLRRLVSESALAGAALVLTHVAADWAGLAVLEGLQRRQPCLAILTTDASWSAPSLAARCQLRRPGIPVRIRAWHVELDRAKVPAEARPDVVELANLFPIARPAIARAVSLVRGAEPARYATAARAQMASQLSSLAERSWSTATLADLVLPDDLLEQVHEIILAARNLPLVRGAGAGRGLCALFNGTPGTGKTLSANVIANELGVPLYRIDVARIVDRYVGETEKNLARIFEEAACDHAVLLFDEADSLFARRTEVNDASDRYANMQVNQLLNLIEDYDGLVFLTTNMKANLDRAVLRRVAYKVQFSAPDERERAALWRHHLARVKLEAPIDIGRLAGRFRVSGGEVKNAVYRSLLVAGTGAVSEPMLVRAIESEMSGNGGVVKSVERRQPHAA